MRWLLVALIVCSTVVGDLLQSHELKRSGQQSADVRGLGRIIRVIVRQKMLILAVLFMAVSFFAFMALVQTEPLSFAVPASAATFVLETLLAKFVLRERVGVRRGAGALLVLCGVVLLAR